MKKKKPLKGTVTHYIVASGRKTRQERRRSSMKDFFEDLENRGPFVPCSLFERFARTVRMQMQREGKWIQNHEDDLEFVADYVSRLQNQYYKFRSANEFENWSYEVIEKGHFAGFQKHYLQYRKLYLKIRIWGLHTKRFRLQRWPLTRDPRVVWDGVRLFPAGFNKLWENNKATFWYDIQNISRTDMTYRRVDLPEGKATIR
jgi:hypothetical protein